MKKWIKLLIPVAAVLALVAWYVFRPERLVVNRRVDEAMPTGQGGVLSQPLESGRFYSILHPTKGTATIFQMGDGTRVLRLTSFSTSNGPDVHVYMVAAEDAKDVATVQHAGFSLRCSHRALIEILHEVFREEDIERPIDGHTHFLFRAW